VFLDTLINNCTTYANKPAIELLGDDGGVQIVTYGQLDDHVSRAMHYLQSLGVQPGDRVALQLPKCLSFVYLHLAAVRLGAITLPLNPAYPAQELGYYLADSEASLFFADRQTAGEIERLLPDLPAIRHCITLDPADHHWIGTVIVDGVFTPPPPATDPHQTAMMLYTSGTTSRPKGAEITHGNLTANLDALHEAWGWQNDDVILHVLPIFHVHGLIVALHGALNAGATAVLLPRFEAQQTLDLLTSGRFTVFMAVPTIHRRLYNSANGRAIDLSHMRLMTSGSDRLPDDLFFGYQGTFGYTLLERYGMTETGMNLSNPLHGERRVGSVGMPLPGVEARIVNPATEQPLPDGEIGEVQIRGPHVCKGYWRQPEKTREAFTDDGWLRTGDMGMREADGYFTLKGRAKDLIITGGLNVYPPEVELVLMEHPAVAACAVIGCPDDEWGEQVTAAIIAVPDADIAPDDLIAFCRQRLAAYKAPRRIIFVDDFPRNALGKIQKAKLRESLCS
jgi:malonyl-CoA/methylmalonyl-CoA synthetase